MYLKIAIVLLFCFCKICKSELCTAGCIRSDERGECIEFEVVEIFEKSPPQFPWRGDLLNILRLHRGVYRDTRKLCPETSGREPEWGYRTTQRPTTTTSTTTTQRPTTVTTTRPTTTTTTTTNPVDEDYEEEYDLETITSDPNSIVYDPNEHKPDGRDIEELELNNNLDDDDELDAFSVENEEGDYDYKASKNKNKEEGYDENIDVETTTEKQSSFSWFG